MALPSGITTAQQLGPNMASEEHIPVTGVQGGAKRLVMDQWAMHLHETWQTVFFHAFIQLSELRKTYCYENKHLPTTSCIHKFT